MGSVFFLTFLSIAGKRHARGLFSSAFVARARTSALRSEPDFFLEQDDDPEDEPNEARFLGARKSITRVARKYSFSGAGFARRVTRSLADSKNPRER